MTPFVARTASPTQSSYGGALFRSDVASNHDRSASATTSSNVIATRPLPPIIVNESTESVYAPIDTTDSAAATYAPIDTTAPLNATVAVAATPVRALPSVVDSAMRDTFDESVLSMSANALISPRLHVRPLPPTEAEQQPQVLFQMQQQQQQQQVTMVRQQQRQRAATESQLPANKSSSPVSTAPMRPGQRERAVASRGVSNLAPGVTQSTPVSNSPVAATPVAAVRKFI